VLARPEGNRSNAGARDLNEEAHVEICRADLRRVLLGKIGIEDLVAINRDPASQLLIAPMSRLIH
jgi:hypothetical protein